METITIEIAENAADALCETLGFVGTAEERRDRLAAYLSSVVASEVRRVLKAKAMADAEAAFESRVGEI
jgi:antirestriction protein ArdC